MAASACAKPRLSVPFKCPALSYRSSFWNSYLDTNRNSRRCPA